MTAMKTEHGTWKGAIALEIGLRHDQATEELTLYLLLGDWP